MIVIGLDISTTNTAYSIMDTERPQGKRLLDSKVIILGKIKDPYAKSCKVRDEFLELSKRYDIEKVVIEESLQSFRSGFSSSRTLSALTRFNGIVSFL